MHSFLALRHVVFCLIAAGTFAPTAQSQVVLGPARYDTSAPVGAGNTKPAANAPGSQSTLKSIFSRGGPLVMWGPLAVRPHTTYSIMQSDGILRIPGQPLNTIQQTITQGLLLELGKTWTFDGTVSRTMFNTRELEDSYSGSATVSGQWVVSDWRFALNQRLESGYLIAAETGGQTKERTASSRAEVGYAAGSKTSVEGSVTWARRKANPATANAAWTGSDWNSTIGSLGINYALTARTQVGASLQAGYDRISNNPDMSYYGPSGRVSWRPTDRVSIAGSAGYEKRTTEGTGGRDFRTPVYSASLGYSPTLTTTLSISASRNISTGYFNDQSVVGESWTASLSQRLLNRLFLSCSYSESRSAYASNVNLPGVDRADRFRSIGVNLGTGFGTRGSVSVMAQQSRNITNSAAFGFKTHTIGADVSYRF